MLVAKRTDITANVGNEITLDNDNSKFLDQLVRLSVGLSDDFLSLSFGFGELGFDFLGVGEAFGDFLTPFLEHRQHAFVSEFVQENADD